jgi:hypothetical protein
MMCLLRGTLLVALIELFSDWVAHVYSVRFLFGNLSWSVTTPSTNPFFFLCDSILIGFLYNQLSIGTGLDSISVRISYVHTCHSASQVLFAHFSIDIISAKALGMKGPRMRVDDKQTGNSSLLLL